MISTIINGITQEMRHLVKANEGMVIFDTNLENDIQASLPLVVLECDDAPESAALFGGVIRMDWSFRMRIYTHEPDAFIDDDSTGSVAHLDFSDVIKNHFIKGDWLTNLMKNLTENYQFRMTYTGTYKAEALKTEDKAIKGFTHNFETICIDTSATSTEIMTDSTQTVTGTITFE
jgi:hypothetical protein